MSIVEEGLPTGAKCSVSTWNSRASGWEGMLGV